MKKMVAFILTAVLIITLAACGGEKSENNNTNNASNTNANSNSEQTPGNMQETNDGNEEQQQPLENITLTALLDSNATFPYDKAWPVWDMIEEQTGVTLDVQVPSGTLSESLSLVIASGNMPDLMYMHSRKNDSNKYGQQGALANILDYLHLMPNLKAWMEQYPEEAKAAIAADGNMYMFPNQGFGETNRMIWMYRKDVFDKHNLQAPTTYDELYDVLKQLKQLYPESYPLAMRFGQIPGEMMAHFTTNFETSEDVYYDFDTSTWKYGAVEDNYREMLATWKKLYDEKLIPQDFLTMQTKQWQDIVSTGGAFITVDYITRIDFFNNAMRQENPEYNMQFMAPPAGIAGGKQQNPYMHFLEGGLTAFVNSKNIERVMQYMDFFYSEEGRTLSSWGKEGVTYTVEGGEKKFLPEFSEDVTAMRKATGLATSGTYTWIDYNAHLSLFSDDLKNAYVEARKYDMLAMQPRPAFTEEENELLSMTGQAVKKHREESFAKFVTGSRSLSEWDKYVEEMNGLGIDKLVETYSEAHKRLDQISF